MKRWLRIQTEPIDESAMKASREMSAGIGAVVVFLGVVRQEEAGSQITALEYEAFEKMVVHQFNMIFDIVEKQWPVECVRLIHRIGPVNVNHASLWVEVTAPHRAEAFAACQFLIDEMKKVVPIWKRAVK